MNNSEEKCKLCGKAYKIFLRDFHDNRYGTPGNYSIGYCGECGLAETFPKPSFDEIPPIYEDAIGDSSANLMKRFYRKLKRSKIGTSIILQLDRGNKLIGALPPASKCIRLLDIGCGCGDWLTFFKTRGYEGQGIDLNPNVVKIAISRGLEVKCKRVEEIEDEKELFDIVVLSQVIEHLLEPVRVLKRIHKLLKKDGRLLVAVPNLGSKWRYFFGRYWINWYVPFHIFHFTRKSLAKVLMESGYVIERIYSYTPPTWLFNSVMVRFFDKCEKPNRHLNKWWHLFLLPLVSAYLFLAETLKNIEGDCLCAIAKKTEGENQR